MLRRDDKDKGEVESVGLVAESESLIEARSFLKAANHLREELDTINREVNGHDVKLDKLEAAATDTCNYLLDLKEEIERLEKENKAETLAVLAEAKTAAAAALEYFSQVSDNITRKKTELENDSLLIPPDEDDEDDLPPLPPVEDDEDDLPPLPSVEDDEHEYFFAHTEAEYTARANIVAPVAANLEGFAAQAQHALLKANSLSVNATTENIRETVRKNINKQMILAKQYKAFLADEIRRFNDVHINADGEERADDFRAAPATAAGVSVADAVLERNQKILQLEAILAVLARAKTSAALPSANAPVENVFYSRMNEQQVFADANETVNMQNATEAAMNYLGRQLQLQQPGAPQRLHAAFGAEPKATVANHKVRFIGTEVVVTPGKLTIPVGMVQKTNEKKTYSEQTFHLAPGHLKKLDDLPFSSRGKMEKIKEQMRFISHAFETSLASITTNGPIEIRNWGNNLNNAAAVYCYFMGYELSPNTALEELKKTPQKLETLAHAFKQQIAEDPVFAKHIDEAIARRDAKIAAEYTPPSPR